MRRRFVQDPETLRLVPADQYVPKKERGILIMPDLEPFVSPVTREVILGRAHMRRHMKEHNLAHVNDFKEEWKKPKYDRNRDKKERTKDIVESMKRKGYL